jgi:HEAT repeat protein
MLVMGALREHPILANRAILQKFLRDSDERVRKAAEEVAAELKALAEMSPKKLVAVPNLGEARQ